MRKRLKSVFTMLRCQLADWLYSPRTVFAGVFLLFFAFANARSFAYTLESSNLYAFPGETAFHFLFGCFGNLSLTSALYLIMMSEIPRRISFQNLALIRSGRKNWYSAQLLFAALTPLITMALLLAASMLFSAPSLLPGTGWSDEIRLLEEEETLALAPDFIRVISPFRACLLAAAILYLFWFTMSLIILLFSLHGKPAVGLILYVSILVLNVTVMWEFLPEWLRWMPANFADLEYIAYSFQDMEFEALPYIFGGYLVTDAALIIGMGLQVKRMDVFFIERK